MPIYEYKCISCGKTCDLLQKFSDSPATECPHCGKTGLERQISAPSFHLKGTGWYATDFKNPPKPKTADNQPTETKESSSESKPDKDQSQPTNTSEKIATEKKTTITDKSEK